MKTAVHHCNKRLFLFFRSAATIQEPGQSEQVTPEARTIGQQAVEPTQMRSDELSLEILLWREC